MSNVSQFLGGDVSTSGNITTQNLVPAGAATAGSAVEIALSGKNTASIQVTGTYTGALSVQYTVDGSTWITMTSTSIKNKITSAGAATIASAAVGIFDVDCSGMNKIRVTALAAVTGTATITLRTSPSQAVVSLNTGATIPTSLASLPALAAGANLIGNVQVAGRTTSTCLTASVKAAASTNATNQKGSAGAIYAINLCNTTASMVYFKLFNLATAPTVGTNTPAFTYGIPANGRMDIEVSVGIPFTAGISYAITGGVGDLDTTAVTANAVMGSFSYA